MAGLDGIDWNASPGGSPESLGVSRGFVEAMGAEGRMEAEWRADVAERLDKLEEQARQDAKRQRNQAIVSTAVTAATSLLCVFVGFLLGRL